MGLRPAKSHEKLVLQDWWGGPPWSAAYAPVGLLAPRKMLMSLCRLRDESSRADQGGRPTGPAPSPPGGLVAPRKVRFWLCGRGGGAPRGDRGVRPPRPRGCG